MVGLPDRGAAPLLLEAGERQNQVALRAGAGLPQGAIHGFGGLEEEFSRVQSGVLAYGKSHLEAVHGDLSRLPRYRAVDALGGVKIVLLACIQLAEIVN